MPPTSNSQADSNAGIRTRRRPADLEARYGKADQYGEYNRRVACPRCGGLETHAHVGLNLFRCFVCDRWAALL